MADNGSADGKSVTENVKEQGQEAASNASAKAQEAVRTQVDQRSNQAGEQLNSLASDLRSVGDQLKEKENEPGAKVANEVADRAEKVGQYLADADAQKILSDAEDFGRRKPWVALAGGIAIGLAGARFLKASSSQRYQSTPAGGYGQAAPATTPTPTPTPSPAIPSQTETAPSAVPSTAGIPV